MSEAPQKTSSEPNQDEWESLLDDMLDEPGDGASVNMAPVRAKVRNDDLERAMVQEEGLAPLNQAGQLAPHDDDEADVKRLIEQARASQSKTSGSGASAKRGRVSLMETLGDINTMMPPRQRKSRKKAAKKKKLNVDATRVLTPKQRLAQIPRKMVTLARKLFDKVLEGCVRISKALDNSWCSWRDVAGITGILLILLVLINCFRPELLEMF